MDRFKFISHALFLYLASGILIYIPMGVILTYLPTGQIDQVKADVDAPEMFSLEWLRSTKNIKCLMIFVYFMGALLYPGFAAVYYKVWIKTFSNKFYRIAALDICFLSGASLFDCMTEVSTFYKYSSSKQSEHSFTVDVAELCFDWLKDEHKVREKEIRMS